MQIPAGTVLTILLAFANTDLAAFGPDAERFDITATRAGHRIDPFGRGLHHCLGSALARAEMAEALRVVAEGSANRAGR